MIKYNGNLFLLKIYTYFQPLEENCKDAKYELNRSGSPFLRARLIENKIIF